MTNKTKIIIAILIIAAIIITIWGIISVNSTKNKSNKEQDEIDNMMEYFEENGEHENNQVNDIEIENNEVTGNSIVETNQFNNTLKKNDSSITTGKQESLGKEEQESNNENTEVNNERTAIELAKKEWEISIDSYNFEAQYKSDGIYEVYVRNKTDGYVNTVYTVNVKTGTVTE